MTNVGEVTGSRTPRPAPIPCVSAVFPRRADRPGRRGRRAAARSASARPSAWVSSGVGSTCSRFTAALPATAVRSASSAGARSAVRAEPDGRRRVVGRPDGPAVDHGAAGPRTWASTVRGPRNHFAADSPSATTTGGSSSSSCRCSQPLQRATSGAFGVRLPGGRHFTTLRTAALRAVQARPRRAAGRAARRTSRRTAGRSRPRWRRAPRRRARPAGGRTTGTSPTTTCCRAAASSGQATQERAAAARVAQSGAAAAMRATSSAAASSRGGRRAATPAP